MSQTVSATLKFSEKKTDKGHIEKYLGMLTKCRRKRTISDFIRHINDNINSNMELDDDEARSDKLSDAFTCGHLY